MHTDMHMVNIILSLLSSFGNDGLVPFENPGYLPVMFSHKQYLHDCTFAV